METENVGYDFLSRSLSNPIPNMVDESSLYFACAFHNKICRRRVLDQYPNNPNVYLYKGDVY